MKTGALLHYAVMAGAIFAKADATAQKALSTTALRSAPRFKSPTIFSMSKPMRPALGKRAGKDADRNKATLVARLGLDGARERRDRLAKEAMAALDQFPEGRKAAILKEAAHFAVSRKS